MIEIMKASAGAGKTYNLAKKYISILLKSEDRYAYRHILAVTFTNKATGEMKARILKELHTLSRTPLKSSYFSDFVPALYPDADALMKRSGEVLMDILHDYSAFSVSTIDKFIQRTLKAFSREIGQFSSYQVELDRKSLIHESVDRILDSITEDSKDILKWLGENVSNQLERGDKVNIENGLYEIAERLKSEEHRELAERCGIDERQTFSKERLSVIRKECGQAIKDFETDVKLAAQGLLEMIDAAGVPLGEFNRNFLAKLPDYAAGEWEKGVPMPSEATLTKAADVSLWFAKSKKQGPQYVFLLGSAFEEALASFFAMFDLRYKLYNTARLLREQTFTLGLANIFYGEFDALLKEKNVMSLDESNTILRDIIGGSDAPFVYEKLGVWFENFLLDEFQDTSTIQWENFRPLLLESDANGNENLVVGDVKQSIYRWRGSDWHLLGSDLGGTFHDVTLSPLRANFRSSENVVTFNNRFFEFASGMLGLGSVYSDVAQEVRNADGAGYVRATFCDAEEMLDRVLASVESAVEAGAGYGDIAVLVRNNKDGGAVAERLMQAGVPVVSDDSLQTKASLTVRRLVSILSGVDNPEDTVEKYLAESLNVEVPKDYRSLVDLCEAILRSLRDYDEETFKGEYLYIQSFMDTLQDWVSTYGNNLMQFLAFWADASPAISSPADASSVKIMSVHKSKGLEFPYVIFPYAEKVDLFKSETHWCKPQDVEGFSASADIFPVPLSKEATKHTLFSGSLAEEMTMQAVDNINIFYVALTRAVKSLHILAAMPSKSFLDKGVPANLSQVLFAFARQGGAMVPVLPESEGDTSIQYEYGEPYDFASMPREEKHGEDIFEASYPSYPLGARLALSTDVKDFFGEDGLAGTLASARLNGIVLHEILSNVDSPEELRDAVDAAVLDGKITREEGEKDYQLLSKRLEAARSRGWFCSGAARNEVGIIDVDGSEHRPDRVEETPEGIVVIDYKFGEKRPSYHRQVERYVRLYREMGYPSVKGYLWYVNEDVVEPAG